MSSCLVCGHVWVTFEIDIGACQGISGLQDWEKVLFFVQLLTYEFQVAIVAKIGLVIVV